MTNGTEKGARNVIVDRSVAYALEIIRLYRDLHREAVGRILGTQLLRAGTSIGANVNEAQAAQSRADFISKMSIARKEARESAYWIRLIDAGDLVPKGRLVALADETEQIVKILTSIILSSKGVPGPRA